MGKIDELIKQYGRNIPEELLYDLTKRQINYIFRQHDESHLWPINGKFNATERAIRRLRLNAPDIRGGIEYYYALEREIGDIVNG